MLAGRQRFQHFRGQRQVPAAVGVNRHLPAFPFQHHGNQRAFLRELRQAGDDLTMGFFPAGQHIVARYRTDADTRRRAVAHIRNFDGARQLSGFAGTVSDADG